MCKQSYLYNSDENKVKLVRTDNFSSKILSFYKEVCIVHTLNKKDAMMLCRLDRKYDMPPGKCTVQTRPAGGNIGRLFLMFGVSVCADQFNKASIR